MDDEEQLLNQYQKTSVTVTLRMFEEGLRIALYWLDGAEVKGILYQRKLEISEEMQIKARERIQLALGVIQQLVEKLDLVPIQENAAKYIKADFSIDWENLSDIHANRLKGFGDPKEGLSEILDPSVDKLSRLALELGSLFERAGARPANPPGRIP